MRALFLTVAAALWLAPAAHAECKGQNLIAELSPDAQAALLFGVTGSGKTLVYLHLIEQAQRHSVYIGLLTASLAI